MVIEVVVGSVMGALVGGGVAYMALKMSGRKSAWTGGAISTPQQAPFLANVSNTELPKDKVLFKVGDVDWTESMEHDFKADIVRWGNSPFATVVPTTREEWLTRGLMSPPVPANELDKVF